MNDTEPTEPKQRHELLTSATVHVMCAQRDLVEASLDAANGLHPELSAEINLLFKSLADLQEKLNEAYRIEYNKAFEAIK